MAARKGEDLEELVRDYFAKQGFFVIRSVKLRFEDEDVTDVDVWAYGKQSASVRTRTLIDVKNKARPKAFERILWARGMQIALRCDRAIVATTDSSDKTKRFAQQQRVALINRRFLDRLQTKMEKLQRLTLEQFREFLEEYKDHKQDGDWIRQLDDAKSALVSLPNFQALNKALAVFRFFAERVQTRAQHKEQAVRCAYLCAALVCIALDASLSQIVYEDAPGRYAAIMDGVTYGDTGDHQVQRTLDTVLGVLAASMDNGKVVARTAREALKGLFKAIRADILAEYFSKEHNAAILFTVAKELESCAHSTSAANLSSLSIEAKSVVGVLADFAGVSRVGLVNGSLAEVNTDETDDGDTLNPTNTPNVSSDGSAQQHRLL